MQCPRCGSEEVIRKGKRKLKHGEIQIYRCNSCKRHFSDKGMKHKSYPAKTILNAISTYNLGYTLEQTKKEIAEHSRIKIPESTIHSWVKEYSDRCRFARLREQTIKFFKPEELIFSHNLQHNQMYKFQLHRAKLELVKGGCRYGNSNHLKHTWKKYLQKNSRIIFFSQSKKRETNYPDPLR